MRERRIEKEHIEREKLNALRQEWTKILADASEFLSKNKPESHWTVPEHKVVLKSSCRDETEKIPAKKKDLINSYQTWKEATCRTGD